MGHCFLGRAKENLQLDSVQMEKFPKHQRFVGVGLALCLTAGLLWHHLWHHVLAQKTFIFSNNFPGGCVRQGWRDGQGGAGSRRSQ